MLGAIIGDIVGSPYEFGDIKSKQFTLLHGGCMPTDDSIMTIAVGVACVRGDLSDEYAFKETLIDAMHELGNLYPTVSYGENFYYWLTERRREPYGSFGNGSAMRVSPTAWAADTLADVERLARWSAEVTHDHPEGVKGAMAVAAAIFMARTGATKEEIRAYVEENYYTLDFTLDEIRPAYSFDVTCQGSVPEALMAFFESTDFEDAIRNAVSLGGDCDTQAAMAGAVAEAFYGIPDDLQEKGLSYLDATLSDYYWSYADELYAK